MGREDPLKEGMATHSSILAREIPWTKEPGRLQSMGSQRHDRVTNSFTLTFMLGREDPLDKAMVTHSSILAWKIPWIEEPVGLQSIG